ncbi:MAG: 4-hydroxyphenylacetate 3-hydroxylase N-terminal domain-containing protein [Leifsonia sp.]|uniref:4-hydroxyphenylacetate 3-hydroxylase N-terminal domain-containing protein n=1 Tax=Leifsonia sp. TaxID=1870902 RepID=UPI003F7D0E1F
MTLRSGNTYLADLDARTVEVAVDGEIVRRGIARHGAFAPTAGSYAQTFDLRLDPSLAELFVRAEETGPFASSLHAPENATELASRTRAVAAVAEHSFGHLLQSPDHGHALVAAFGRATAWFAGVDPAFGERVAAYLAHVRSADLAVGYALSLPEVNRQPDGSDQLGGQMAARVIEHRADGIVLSGARMMASSGPLCDEILLLPATVAGNGPDEAPYSFAVAVPADAPGVRFVCRAVDTSGSVERFGRRYDEVQTAIVLEDVFIPHERVFLLGAPAACNEVYRRTGAAALLVHQATVRRGVKAEFYFGLATELAHLLGVDHYDWVGDLLAEARAITAACRAAVVAAEAEAGPNEWGMWEPDWRTLASARIAFAPAARRLPQILQEIGGPRLLMSPDPRTAAAAAADVEAFFQSRFLSGPERVEFSHLVSEVAVSGFAARQVVAETHLFGDPRRLSGVLGGAEGELRDRARGALRTGGRAPSSVRR